MSHQAQIQGSDRRPLILAGIVLGLGQGGFFDGIVFHQLLQWHHMFSELAPETTIAGLELNTVGDGLFHLLDWILTLTGLALLWRAVLHKVPLSTATLIGSILIGAGLFNLVEGVIDHHLLGIHHVKPGLHQMTYDISFLVAGAVLVVIGWRLVTPASEAARSHS
jgi:uncharacterized membrane protein